MLFASEIARCSPARLPTGWVCADPLRGAGSLQAQAPKRMAYSNEPAGAVVAYVT